MTDLTPSSALGSDLSSDFGACTLSENIGIGLASLACAPDITPFGLTLPTPGKMAESQSGHRAAWLSPGQWLILSPHQADTDIAARLRADLGAEIPAKITEQTDGWVVLDLTARNATSLQQVLAHLVNLPAGATAPGCATRSLVHHMSVLLLRPSATQITILGLRSYADSLVHALIQTLRTHPARSNRID